MCTYIYIYICIYTNMVYSCEVHNFLKLGHLWGKSPDVQLSSLFLGCYSEDILGQLNGYYTMIVIVSDSY